MLGILATLAWLWLSGRLDGRYQLASRSMVSLGNLLRVHGNYNLPFTKIIRTGQSLTLGEMQSLALKYCQENALLPPPEALNDPLTTLDPWGSPIRIKVERNDHTVKAVIYSLGANMQDDGGRWDDICIVVSQDHDVNETVEQPASRSDGNSQLNLPTKR